MMIAAPVLADGQADSSGRYLLIVDTSRSMRHRSKAMLEVVAGLLNSGMDGEMKAGDTLGLWTFNKDLYAGHFPLEIWAPEQQQAIVQRVAAFLKAQSCEKQPSLEKVMPALKQVVQESELITIVVISAGDARVSGTPFDGPINDDFDRWQTDPQNAQVPLVTIIRARHGKMVRCAVKPASEKIELPPLPAPPAVAARPDASQTPAAPPAVPAAPEPPRIGQPLILSGKKLHPQTTNTAPAPAPKPEPPRAQAEPPRSEAAPPQAGTGPAPAQPEPPRAETASGGQVPAPAHLPASPTPTPAPSVPAGSSAFEPVPMAGSYRALAATEPPGTNSGAGVSEGPASRPRPESKPPGQSLGLWARLKAHFRKSPPLAAQVEGASKPQARSLAPPKAGSRPPAPSGGPGRLARLAGSFRAISIPLWKVGVGIVVCCLGFLLLRLRGARQAQTLSLITRSLDRNGMGPDPQGAFRPGAAPRANG